MQEKHSTYSNQSKLPKLPIPQLKDTCEQYINVLSTLQDPISHEKTRDIVHSFLNNEGEKLQKELIEYANEKKSYIEEFWYHSYLVSRGSVVLNLNPFFILEDDPTPSRNNQISRGASLILSSLKFINVLRKEELEPDIWRNNPLCMHQFKYLFGSTRIPTENRDIVTHSSTSKNIIILCRNQFYSMDVIWMDGTVAITENQLKDNLYLIQKDAFKTDHKKAAEEAIGVLTADDRANWARLRKLLEKDNKEILEIIDSALFLVCLDNTSPNTASQIAATALHGTYDVIDGIQTGTCINRWYDKLQFIICENGSAGLNFEHTSVDGHTVLRFVSDIFTDTIIRFAQSIRGGSFALFNDEIQSPETSKDPNRPNIIPKKLEFVLKNIDLLFGIRYAESKLSDLILQNDIKVLEFKDYGKNFIVQNKLSPDSFIQLALMTSYYLLYGTAPNTYEAVLTKKFLHGRTEAARSFTPAVLSFIENYCRLSYTNFTDYNESNELYISEILTQMNLFRAAILSHVNLVKKASNGYGIDRHLFALKCISDNNNNNNNKMPEIFLDNGWNILSNTVLSTSNCGNPSLRLFGFGPVVLNGFGIGYIIKDNGIQFCVSSKHRQTERYLNILQDYLLNIQKLLYNEEIIKFPNLHTSNTNISSLNIVRTISLNNGYGFFDSGSSDRLRQNQSKRIEKLL